MRGKNKLLIAFASGLLLSIADRAFAAFVPCGGPGQHSCTICDFFSMTAEITKYAVIVLVPLAIVFLIVTVWLLYAGSLGDSSALGKARKILLTVVFGMLIVFAGWVSVNTFLASIGIADWNGAGLNQNWWKVSAKCAAIRESSGSCGDEILQNDEECEPKMTIEACQARYGWSKGKCESAKAGCSLDCILPEIETAQNTTDEDQKENQTDNAATEDYCLKIDNTITGINAVAQHQSVLNEAAKDAAKAARIMPKEGTNCVNACKQIGKTCIGIGTYDQLNCNFMYAAPPCCWEPPDCEPQDSVKFCHSPSHLGYEYGNCSDSSTQFFASLKEKVGVNQIKNIPTFEEVKELERVAAEIAPKIALYEISMRDRENGYICIDQGEYQAMGKNCSKVSRFESGSAFCYCK